jgi:hypothetical protein
VILSPQILLSRSIALAFGRFDTFRFAILMAPAAIGMVVQPEADGLEPRF